MQACYKHPKLQAVAQCRKCKMPSCVHCIQDDYCADCYKLISYIRSGDSGRKPQLVETPRTRSKTMELVMQRLHHQVFDSDAASRREARNLIQQVQKAKKRPPVTSQRVSVKTREPITYGFLMPGVAPLVKVTRSPLSRLAVVAVLFFALGLFVAQSRTSYAEPAAPAEVVSEADAPQQVRTVERVVTHYKPVYIYVTSPAPASQVRMPKPSNKVVSVAAVRYQPAVASAAH